MLKHDHAHHENVQVDLMSIQTTYMQDCSKLNLHHQNHLLCGHEYMYVHILVMCSVSTNGERASQAQ